MVKSYIIAGALLLTSLIVIGGISFNSSNDDRGHADRAHNGAVFSIFGSPAPTRSPAQSIFGANSQEIGATESGVKSGFYKLFAAAEPVTTTSEEGGELVPLPYWVLQKLFSDGEVTSSPAPCPVWMLYQMGITKKT